MKKNISRFLSLMICCVLVASMALLATGCGNKTKKEESSKTDVSETSTTATETVNKLGEGQKQFNFDVVDGDGKVKKYDIHTDKSSVGEALVELNLIAGEQGDYGLYVKTVDGITINFDDGGYYWAFYVNDKYAEKSCDQTDITEGSTYMFKAQK